MAVIKKNDKTRNNFSINTLIHDIEKVHSIFFEFIDYFLMKKNIFDINSKQIYVLYLAHKEGLTKIKVNSLYRYYKGTNVSYNVKLMVNSNYITNQEDNDDRRSNIISLTKKSKRLIEELDVELNKFMKKYYDTIDYGNFSLFMDNVCQDMLVEMEYNK